MSKHNKGIAFAATSALLYGFIPILGKTLVVYYHPLFVAFMVVFLSGIFIGVVAIWRRAIISNLNRKSIALAMVIGFFAALGSIFAFFGLTIGKANEAGFLFQLESFFAAVIAFYYLKEKLSKNQVIGLVTLFLGAYIFTTSFSFSFKLGSLFFLGSAFVWGVIDVVVKKNRGHLSPFFLAFGRNFFSAIILFPLALQYLPSGLKMLTVGDVFIFLFYGLIVSGIIMFLYLALGYIKTAEATSYQIASPIITATLAFFVFGEYLNSTEIIGAVMIIIGLFLMKEDL